MQTIADVGQTVDQHLGRLRRLFLFSPRKFSPTEEERARYERDGVVCLRGVFGEEWLSLLREATEEVLLPGILFRKRNRGLATQVSFRR